MNGPDPVSARVALCASCTRLTVDTRPGQFGAVCAAFPDGIPDAIFSEGFDHRHRYDGDHGVLYEPDPTRSAVLLAYEVAHT